jgi:hypothetical protein
VGSILLAVALLAGAQARSATQERPAAPPKPQAGPPGPALGPLPAAPLRPPAPQGLSWDDADELARTLLRLERRLATGRAASDAPLVVTERQLNSYVNLSLASRLPVGVSALRLQLQQDRLGAQAQVDLDRVKGQLPAAATGGLLSLLSGTVPVELQGRLIAANGTGRVEIEQASVGGVGLPASLIAQVVSLSTRSAKRPQGLDILAPFPLPWTARDVRFEPGRAAVSFFVK